MRSSIYGCSHRLAILGAVLLHASAAASPALQTTTRVSVSSTGAQTNGGSSVCQITPDGRFVVFQSWGNQLVPGDFNGDDDIFVHDRQSAQTTKASVDSNGVPANRDAQYPAISADGRFVVFTSTATNLVPADTDFVTDAFLRDRASGTTSLVSVDSAGIKGNGSCLYTSISADGRYVAFSSLATNLVGGDTNNARDVFVHDRASAITTRVSVDSSGAQADGHSLEGAISPDGRFVVMYSLASNLVAGDTNGVHDVFVHELASGQTTRVSMSSSGAQGDGASQSFAISADGRFVAFQSSASNLVAGDTNGKSDCFLHDRSSGQTSRVSVGASGSQSNGDSGLPAITPDGSRVAFSSFATNLTPADTSVLEDVFVRDMRIGQLMLVSPALGGTAGNGNSKIPSLSADARCVAFRSGSSNLVPGDTNNRLDIFVRDDCAALQVYCTAKTSSQGCAPAIAFSGTPSASDPTAFLISASQIASSKEGMLFYGLAPAATPFQGGTKCVAAPIRRTPMQGSGGSGPCTGSFSYDFNARIQSGADPALVVGAVVFAQWWYRDGQDPTGFGTGLSDAVSFTICD